MNLRYSTAVLLLFFSSQFFAQVSYTANDQVFQYQGQFRGGYNSGFAAGWSDLSIATLAAGDPTKYVIGVGLKSNRDALFFEALEPQGYASKMEEVWHYDSLGLKDLTALIIGGEGGAAPEPPAPYRDTSHYCPTKQSTLFANLYTDIWDGGANGTPYNDENYFAAYMYKTVDQYKDFITFWEIWNEPGFDFSGNHGWRKPGDPEGNWWDEDPDPCDYKLGAPVQHYVRTLRIAWEIIKTLDPNSFVCMGAPGFPSFVDAVARNTDNPVDGSVTADYPLKGGAYFDAMTYHSFPHFDDSFVTSEVPFKIERNSDVAANSVIRLRDSFEGVLENYGYDGATFPRKQFLITEINLPRKIFDYNIKTYGGEIAQRNFMMKAFMNCKIANIWQMHVYTFGELKSEADAVFEFELMGLYKNMDNTNYFSALPTGAGVGVSTTAPLLWDTDHDPARSALLTNDDVRVEAFKRADGTYVYALWAIMKSDFNEYGTAYYNFPSGLGIPDFLRKYEWKHSITGEKFVSSNQNVTVDGTPVFLVEEDLTGEALPNFTVSPFEGCIPYQITYTNASQNADSVRWEFQNGSPQFSTDLNPIVTYSTEGFHTVNLTAYKGAESNTNRQDYYMHARDEPVPGFIATFNFGNAFFLNTTYDADSFHWDFGDGGMSTEEYPAHTYAKNGKYEVTLTAINPCGTVIYKDSVEVLYALEVDFLVAQSQGCRPHTVQYQANSPLATEYKWFFPGGNPDTSTIATPVVTYDTAGIYGVSLSVANGASGGTITKDSFIVILEPSDAGFTHSINGLTVSLADTSVGTNTAILWDFGDGNTSSNTTLNHTYATQGIYDVALVIGGPCGTDTAFQEITVWEVPSVDFSSDVQQGCAPLSVQFFNTGSDGEGNTYNWIFSGGTPSQSPDENPSVVFENPGIYDVSFTISNPAGTDTKTLSQSIEVLDVPSSMFNSSTNELELTFSNQSSAATAFYWDFGDGNTSVNQNPVHNYVSQGVYDVILVSSSMCGMDTSYATVSAYEVPVAEFTSSVNEGCAPFSVSFSNAGSNGVGNTYEWDLSGANPSTSIDENPTVVYEIPGHYDVSFTVSNPAGTDTKTITQTIEVNAPTVADFSSSVQYLTVDFSNLSSNAFDYLWHFGNGISSMLDNPSYTFDTAGIHTITLISYNSCSTDTIMYEVTTYPVPPSADFTLSDTAGCGPLSVQFFNESVGVIDSLFWVFPNGNPSTSIDESPIVTYNQSGSYEASLIVKNVSGSDTLNFSNIEVFPEATADFTYQQQGYTLCFDPGTSTNYDSLSWTINGTNQSTDVMPCVTFNTDTSLQIPTTLVAYGVCGNDTLDQVVDLLISKPEAAFEVDTTAGCVPIEVQYATSQTNVDSMIWFFEGGDPMFSNDPNPNVSYIQSGLFSVMQIVENEFGIDTLFENNYINAEPSPFTFFGFAISNDTARFQNQSTPNYNTYFWDFGNGMTSTLHDPEIVFIPGTYTVTLTAQNPCGTEFFTQTVTILTNTSTLTDGTTVGIYPNPTTSDIWFVFEGGFDAQTVDIQIFNEIGQLVLTKMNHTVDEQISLLSYPAGLYTIQLKTERGARAILRVVKE